MVHQSSLCYRDLTLRHFVVSPTSVKRALAINWKSVCTVSTQCWVVVFNRSKFILNKGHSRTVSIFCFHLKKTVTKSQRLLREAYGEHAPSQDGGKDGFGVSKAATSRFQTRNTKKRWKIDDVELQALLDEVIHKH